MADDVHEKPAADNVDENGTQFPAVSGITFDDKTGTVTLKLANEREKRNEES
jgi:hypothetical protein